MTPARFAEGILMPEVITCECCGTWNWRKIGEGNNYLRSEQEADKLNAKPKDAFYCHYCWHKNNIWIEVVPE